MIFGKVKVKITSIHTATIINRLRNIIPLRDINLTEDNVVSFTTTFSGAKKAAVICSELTAQITVISEKGLPVIFNRIKRRYGLYAGAVLACVIVCFSSVVIWEVRVEGNENVSSIEIERVLRTCGFGEGSIKNRNILEKIYNNYLISEPRISWISINFDGTVAHVEVKETKSIPEKLNRDKNINIVASSDGVIKRIDVLDGSREVETGETVTKGQLLISSFVDTRKTGTLMKAARGNVWASTIHNYTIYVMKSKNVRNKSGFNENFRYLQILGTEIPLNLVLFNNKNISTTRVKNARFSILNEYNFPFKITTESKSYYDIKETTIDKNTAVKIAEAELQNRISTDLKGAEIIKKDYTQSEENDMYIFNYELSCIENIAKETEFHFQENS